MNYGKENGIVSLWDVETAEWIKPDKKVWVPRLTNGHVSGLIFDYAYTSAESARDHCHWISSPYEGDRVELITMPFEKYLDKHLKEVKPMNPFFTLNRERFLNAYRNKRQ